ncbi:MAG: 30S ribosomal protein S6 [Candidatus Magasanikbacteria bacterium GW2011_GWA2_56_11]|uniref:Small ribosomal subunit protein bS6 n=1 Tax=Candidatus Magasanikbacteria bacterium GW2011_GWA2_56_11 TaxID=1619044 RepID=A0A0G2BB21_9BACT|nr:MAG: 30S ribosomal protein S6 [Candidatus Magasanikbacteria bacterium GW2011_GWA2_56_11]
MKHYEMLAVLPGTLAEADVPPVATVIKETLERFGGTDVSLNDMGKSRLAYPMQHIRYGYFYLVHFRAEADRLKEIQERVRLVNNVLRFVVRAFDSESQILDTAKLNLTPVANVVGGSETETAPAPAREPRREYRSPVKEKAAEETRGTEPTVSMEDIEDKLDQILEKDLEKV